MVILLALALSVAAVQLSLPKILRVAFFYTGVQALMLCATTHNRYGGLAALDQMAISNRSAQVLIALTLLLVYLSHLVSDRDGESLEARGSILRVFIWVYGVLVLEQLSLPSWGILAMLGAHCNASHMVSLVVAMSPVILLRPGNLNRDRPAFLILLAICMFLADAVVPMLVLISASLGYLAAIFRFSNKIKVFMLLESSTIGILGYIYPRLSNGRFEIWARMLKYWWAHSNVWIGFGPGSFELFGPKIQHASNFMTGSWFIWMHNDWLQILFELGVIGFILWAIAYAYTCWLAYHRRGESYLFGSLIGLGVMGLVNYPLHQAESLFFGVLLVSLVLGGKKRDGRN